MIRNNSYSYIIASDGSKLGKNSYGKTGASAVMYKNDVESTPSLLKSSLGTESNSYYAEMIGIELGLRYMSSVEEPSNVLLLSDCISALKAGFQLPIQLEYNSISRSNLRRVIELEEMGDNFEAA